MALSTVCNDSVRAEANLPPASLLKTGKSVYEVVVLVHFRTATKPDQSWNHVALVYHDAFRILASWRHVKVGGKLLCCNNTSFMLDVVTDLQQHHQYSQQALVELVHAE